MSKIGKMPINIKENITIALEGKKISVSGSRGNLFFMIPQGIEVKVEDSKIVVTQKNKTDDVAKPLHGLTRAIIANMVKGVSEGFEKKLELSGVGYRAQVSGNDLMLSVGFSHQVKIKALENIKFAVNENVITVYGIDKTLVGDMAARIRAVRPPEPYKGKGIKYVGERIRRKVGKAAKAVGAK